MTQTTKYYTGVGSRSTPSDILTLMTALAAKLEADEYALRSGGADGADKAFEAGTSGSATIYLPWPYFNDCSSAYTEPTPQAVALAATVHPNWSACSRAAKLLHARNCHQVLGWELTTPSQFCLCWTPDGAQAEAECTRQTGGTATAIRLACRHGVPVFNLQRLETRARLEAFLNPTENRA